MFIYVQFFKSHLPLGKWDSFKKYCILLTIFIELCDLCGMRLKIQKGVLNLMRMSHGKIYNIGII